MIFARLSIAAAKNLSSCGSSQTCCGSAAGEQTSECTTIRSRMRWISMSGNLSASSADTLVYSSRISGLKHQSELCLGSMPAESSAGGPEKKMPDTRTFVSSTIFIDRLAPSGWQRPHRLASARPAALGCGLSIPIHQILSSTEAKWFSRSQHRLRQQQRTDLQAFNPNRSRTSSGMTTCPFEDSRVVANSAIANTS